MREHKMNKPNSLFYLNSINRFADEEWYIVHDIRKLFDIWQLDRWKRNGRNDRMIAKDGQEWVLYYLDDDEEDDILELISWNESFGIKMDRYSIKEMR